MGPLERCSTVLVFKGNTKYFDQISRSSFSGLTKREKGSHKKLEEEAQNEKLTEMLIMKLEHRHLDQ